MTRRSKREIERALEEYGDVSQAKTLDEWVEHCWEAAIISGEIMFTYTVVDSGGEVVEAPDRSDEICVQETGSMSLWVPSAAVPEWIDAEEDLPVGQ